MIFDYKAFKGRQGYTQWTNVFWFDQQFKSLCFSGPNFLFEFTRSSHHIGTTMWAYLFTVKTKHC